MGYYEIENLYKDQRILMFKECYAMEKIHGTSAKVIYKRDNGNPKVLLASGGAPLAEFSKLFSIHQLITRFGMLDQESVTVYGEAYGGKMQAMSHTYGKQLKFVAFEVKIGDQWLSVDSAHDIATRILDLEFVHYNRIPTTLEALDAERDSPSVQAVRNGITEPREREGVVLRPIVELIGNDGKRIITKHKGEKFRETATQRKIIDPDKLEVLKAAKAIADEWVTDMRLSHVLQAFPDTVDLKDTASVIKAMYDDVIKESKGEIEITNDLRKAIGTNTARIFKKRVMEITP